MGQYGYYAIKIIDGKEYIVYGRNCVKCFELPVSSLTLEQKQFWLDSLKSKKPVNPLTYQVVKLDSPIEAMLMILSSKHNESVFTRRYVITSNFGKTLTSLFKLGNIRRIIK